MHNTCQEGVYMENARVDKMERGHMQRTNIGLIILIAVICGALAGAGVTVLLKSQSISQMTPTPVSDTNQMIPAADPDPGNNSAGLPQGLTADEEIITRIYKHSSPSVVHINSLTYYRNFWGVYPQEGTGSGFIMSQDGYILTNNHVVANAQEITVRLFNGDEYTGVLVGTDPVTDIAVLKIDDVEIEPEWVSDLGDSDALQVGQQAIAIGNPFGLDSTVTVGVISALNRPLEIEGNSFDNMIQTDASINPGNSGGPLINSSGDVIGINTVIFSQSGGSHGIGFAIPINVADRIANDLIAFGRVKRPNLGFSGLSLMPNLARYLNLSVQYGVLVQSVETESSAARAGLRGGTNLMSVRSGFNRFSFYPDGDIIVAADGVKITEISQLSDMIRKMDLGAEVDLQVIRDGEEIHLTWTLSE
ncbi:MAG TPA: trypsin-like peptidase domain-containing protein [bacterium]|jgi:S1-C subfamily serine protease